MHLIRNHWLICISALATLIGLPALFMAIDANCSPITNTFCRQWLRFQWETVLAGYAGLAGAAIAIYGLAIQIRHDSKNRITGQMHFPLIAAQTMREIAQKANDLMEYLAELSKLERVKDNHRGKRYKLIDGSVEIVRKECIDVIRSMRSSGTETVRSVREKHTESIPHKALAHIDKMLGAFNFPLATKHTGEDESVQYGTHLQNTLSHLKTIKNEANSASRIIEETHKQRLDSIEHR